VAGLTPTAPLAAPEALREDHDTDGFDSGEPTLDIWLARRARANQISGASRTYVVCRERKVVGYHALASGGIDLDAAPGRLRRNMPDPLPVVVKTAFTVSGSRNALMAFSDSALRVFQ